MAKEPITTYILWDERTGRFKPRRKTDGS